MNDRILTSFLERQLAEGVALAEDSDLLDLLPLGPVPIHRFLARFPDIVRQVRDGLKGPRLG